METLQGAGPFTVFAPTDDAFAALPAGTLDKLLADPAALKQVLLYHVVSGKVTSDKVVDLTSADSVEGAPIAITVKDGKVYLNGSTQVVTPDVQASNGVIHVIDHVLLPPAAQASPAPAASMAAAGDIVATAKSACTFATLLKAAQAAGLVDTLEGAGPFTVFAPTDDAFAALPAGTLDKLLADPAALKKILLYHVVAGAVTADQVVGLTSATSVEGGAHRDRGQGRQGLPQRRRPGRGHGHRRHQRRHPCHRPRHPAAVELTVGPPPPDGGRRRTSGAVPRSLCLLRDPMHATQAMNPNAGAVSAPTSVARLASTMEHRPRRAARSPGDGRSLPWRPRSRCR